MRHVEESAQAAGEERHRVEFFERQGAAEGGRRDIQAEGGAADVGRDQQWALAPPVCRGPGEEAEENSWEQSGRHQPGQVGRARIQQADRRERERQARHHVAEVRDGGRGPEAREVPVAPEAAAGLGAQRVGVRRSASSSTEPFAGARSSRAQTSRATSFAGRSPPVRCRMAKRSTSGKSCAAVARI